VSVGVPCISAGSLRSAAGSVAVAALVVVVSGCRADANVVEILATDEPDVLDVIVDTCNADLDVDVAEDADEVAVEVRNNDRELFAAGGDDCQDAVRIDLDEPLGERRLRVDGREMPLTTYPPESDEPGFDVVPTSWQIDPAAQLDSASVEVPILVKGVGCTTGDVTADRIEVSVDDGSDELMFAVGVRLLVGEQLCRDRPATVYVVELDEPLGSRTVRGEGQTGTA
jgi:hypothetical protein